MNKLFSATTLLYTILILAGCQVPSIEEELSEIPSAPVQFSLTATYGDPDSKAAFDEDGLNMSWTPGDVLKLIDPTGTNKIVTLTTDITEAVKTATFRTKEVVSPGEYIVLYGQNTLQINKDIIMKSANELSGQVRLYGSLMVEQDQTSAEITLKHLFAMLTFKFKNIPAGFEATTMGMAVASEGLKNLDGGIITADGLETEFSNNYCTFFGWNNGKDSKSLIAPVDLSGKKIFFFVWGRNAEDRHTNYEFAKNGINLLEGNNYNITLDFSKATESTIYRTTSAANILTSAADFRAAAYWHSGLTYELQNDIDFTDEVVFPIYSAGLWGNGHTLSNINIDLAQCTYVGILSEGHGHNLNVVSSSITGLDRVGSICGYGYCENCTSNSVTVNGRKYVGGLVGHCNQGIQACSLLGESLVNGSGDFVGGITGQCTHDIKSCFVKGTVQVIGGGEYTGGIAGVAGNVSACGVEASVKGGRYTGGASGTGPCSGSYCYGDVTGTESVGGVSGDSNCTGCYHIGSVTGTAGASNVGGISGAAYERTINYCYSYGTISSGYGIAYLLNEECASTNLTSEARFSSNIDASDNCNCGPSKTFLSNLSVIQNSDNSYVEACWPGLDARCPLLTWQYEFGGDFAIPGFKDIMW